MLGKPTARFLRLVPPDLMSDPVESLDCGLIADGGLGILDGGTETPDCGLTGAMDDEVVSLRLVLRDPLASLVGSSSSQL